MSTNTHTPTSTSKNVPEKKNHLLQTFINYGTVIAFFVVAYLIYRFFIKANGKVNRDGFANKNDNYNDNDTQENFDTVSELDLNPVNTQNTQSTEELFKLEPTITEQSLELDPINTKRSSGTSGTTTTQQSSASGPSTTNPSPGNTQKSPGDSTITSTNTIYEQSINNIYGKNKRFYCSLLPTINPNSNTCKVNNIPYIKYKFPIHIIKLLDDSIVAVFNDGYMYTKNNINETLWQGPIENSMPQTNIPLRMIALNTDLLTLLGVGYNNILYQKTPNVDSSGINTSINLTGTWKQVPNNSNIIYVLFDNITNFLISIDIYGNLFTKKSLDITSVNKELKTLIGRPVLRLYYDLNGYMLAIDNHFDLYQFTGLNWKTTPLQLERGANSSKVHDILYDNDGKLYGLVFNNDEFKIQIMKQKEVFYLSNFYKLDVNFNKNTQNNFLLSNRDILKCKIGSLYDFLIALEMNDTTDEDTNYAFQKQVMESEADLRQFCSTRNANTTNENYNNFELLGNVENNNDKIVKLQNVIKNLMAYEPDRANLQDKYPILNTNKERSIA